MTVHVWSGVTVKMQSALGTPLVVTAVSKAAIGVAAFTPGTDPTIGDYLLMTAEGMHEISGRVFRAGTVVAGTSFQLAGENTTNYGTYVSGTATPITFGTTLLSARGVTASGGEPTFIDISTIHDKVDRQRPGNTSAASFGFECFWDPGDAALVAMKAASDEGAERAFQITFDNGALVVFNGYVSASLLPGGSAGDVVTTQVTITMSGTSTAYAS